MPGITRAGIDRAVGLIVDSPQDKVYLEGFPIAIKGSKVLNHGGGPHLSASIIEASEKFTIGGFGVVLEGSKATCLDVCTGSSKMSCT